MVVYRSIDDNEMKNILSSRAREIPNGMLPLADRELSLTGHPHSLYARRIIIIQQHSCAFVSFNLSLGTPDMLSSYNPGSWPVTTQVRRAQLTQSKGLL